MNCRHDSGTSWRQVFYFAFSSRKNCEKLEVSAHAYERTHATSRTNVRNTGVRKTDVRKTGVRKTGVRKTRVRK